MFELLMSALYTNANEIQGGVQVIELKKERFRELIPILRTADINSLFAMSVLEGKVGGKVFVDDSASPASFYLQHPYGMNLLFGENGKEDFYESLKPHLLDFHKTRKKAEWLQVYPAALYSKMDTLLADRLRKKDPEEPYSDSSVVEAGKVLEYQRINFIFQQEKYLSFRKSLPSKHQKIVSTTELIFNRLAGSVVPKYFWNSFRDFEAYGIGFTLLLNDKIPASTAFASFVIDRKLEIGIETVADYRGSGFAASVCAQLIDYCLEHGLEPVWSCNSGNIGSRKLAQKLGFEECKRIPYYRLPLSF
ncbi:GNAT family N-acetyltransferase [Sporolactobacillus shoreicorticis]|uniref:GNAT family N-acetyltransferase n=1 Tax=Sporolactobacillus shoreicorticis TaxID=1923877 RepID=A0ABW5S2I5_9BACL|nr:GNAT family N-acetyltransferase [Sporolactobacillus shoreicorticis]MCO7126457.1 GNAT family N-acetyltransferase [Sporolactobacillus shoreicorticis]